MMIDDLYTSLKAKNFIIQMLGQVKEDKTENRNVSAIRLGCSIFRHVTFLTVKPVSMREVPRRA